MADFNVDLSAPRAQGAQPVAPVQEQVVPAQPNQLLGGIANIFAKGLEIDNKMNLEARKAAVVNEYINNEQVYTDAFTSGQWSAAQAASASRINFQKMYAAYGGQYGKELHEARANYMGGTDMGEAQKQVEQNNELVQHQLKKATDMGFLVPAGASDDLKKQIIVTAQAETRANNLSEQANKMAAEQRAVASAGYAANADKRAEGDYLWTLNKRKAEDDAQAGIIDAVDKHFDLLGKSFKETMLNPALTPEQRQFEISNNLSVFKAKLTAISGKNAELAAPWVKIFDEMATVASKLSDPSIAQNRDAKQLENEYNSLLYKAKLAIVADPDSRNAVAASNLFGNNPMIGLAISPAITGMLAKISMGPNAAKPNPPIVNTSNEKDVLNGLQKSLNMLQNNNATGDKVKMQQEAVNATDEIIKQTGGLDKGIDPTKLKNLATFYSSPEFGKLAEQGLLNKQSVKNAADVFAVSFEPAVVKGISDRLETVIERSPGRDLGNRGKPSQKLIDTVNIRFSGMGVSLDTKPGAFDTLSSSIERDSLKEAEKGLNQLIRIGAHMEGTTDYAKYWEANKHLFLPKVYPDPNKLKVGQVVKAANGKSYKYLGGNFNDIANSYMEVKVGNGE